MNRHDLFCPKPFLTLVTLLAGILISLHPNTGQATNLLTNPGFETGNFTGWTTSSTGIPPDTLSVSEGVYEGSFGGFMTSTVAPPGDNGSIRQSITLDGPGTYQFGAWVRFLALDPVANFVQGQITLGISSLSQFVTVGIDPNALLDSFVPSTDFSPSGVQISDWVPLSGLFDYTGPGNDVALLNINLQNSVDRDSTAALLVDNAFVSTAIPIPGTLTLAGLGLAGLGLQRRYRSDR